MDFAEWITTNSLVPYHFAVKFMEQRVTEIRLGEKRELVWLLEHPPIYTKGSTANRTELLGRPDFPVFETGRGGRYTYHGPGQRVIYVMLDLQNRNLDVRCYVKQLEQWLIDSLSIFNIGAERRPGRIGIWVVRDNGSEAKIGAIGVRIRRSVSFHGASLNIDPNLDHYKGIVPCGISDYDITSISDLGLNVKMPEIDKVLRQTFKKIFGEITDTNSPHIPASDLEFM